MPDKPLRVRASAVLVLAGSMAGLTACTALPTDGKLHTSSLVANQNAVQVTSRSWNADMNAVEVVKNFQQAVAGDDGDPAFGTAQTYLTAAAAKSWIHPQSKYWVGDTQVYDHLDTEESSGTPAPDSKQVTVLTTGNLLATVDAYGAYHAEDPTENSQTYTLTRVGADSWKISTPPPVRLVAVDDFRRTTPAPLPVFEVPSSASDDARVVQHIDQVYLLKAAGQPTYTYQQLADALLRGQNMKAAVQLDANGGNVTVTLSGALPLGWDYTHLAEAMTQTFQAASVPQAVPSPVPAFSSLTLLCTPPNGPYCPGSSPGTVVQTDLPDQPTVYYAAGNQVVAATSRSIKNDATFNTQRVASALGDDRTFGALAVKHITQPQVGAPSAGPNPANAGPAIVAAYVADGADAGWVVVADDGQPKAAAKRWYHATGAVTSLDWDPIDGALWVVDGGELHYVRPNADGTGDDLGIVAVVPKSVPEGSLQRFKLSPDGRQAAIVTDGTSDLVTKQPLSQAWMVQMDRPAVPGSSVPGADGEGYPLLADLKSVTDVAWAGRRALVLLGAEKANTAAKLYQVYADGSQDATLLGATADAESSSTVIAAQGVDAGTPKFRIFSDGSAGADAARTVVYWKGQTFDPVITPPPTAANTPSAPSSSSPPPGSKSQNQTQNQTQNQANQTSQTQTAGLPSQSFPTLATLALR